MSDHDTGEFDLAGAAALHREVPAVAEVEASWDEVRGEIRRERMAARVRVAGQAVVGSVLVAYFLLGLLLPLVIALPFLAWGLAVQVLR